MLGVLWKNCHKRIKLDISGTDTASRCLAMDDANFHYDLYTILATKEDAVDEESLHLRLISANLIPSQPRPGWRDRHYAQVDLVRWCAITFKIVLEPEYTWPIFIYCNRQKVE